MLAPAWILALVVVLGPPPLQVVSWSDDCEVTVWDEDLQLCYSEGGEDGNAACSEWRTYGLE